MGGPTSQIPHSAADPNAKYRDMVGDGNALFAKLNTKFQQCCERAGVEPTRRQASKWRRGFGRAWAAK